MQGGYSLAWRRGKAEHRGSQPPWLERSHAKATVAKQHQRPETNNEQPTPKSQELKTETLPSITKPSTCPTITFVRTNYRSLIFTDDSYDRLRAIAMLHSSYLLLRSCDDLGPLCCNPSLPQDPMTINKCATFFFPMTPTFPRATFGLLDGLSRRTSFPSVYYPMSLRPWPDHSILSKSPRRSPTQNVES